MGLCFGSFYNVCISRLPKDESIIKARSHCPNCGAAIAPYDLIPVLSYILLGGKCRSCKAKISVRYAVVEVLTAGMLYFSVHFYGYSAQAAASFAFLSLLTIISFIDIETLFIPDILVIFGIILGLVYHSFTVEGFAFAAIGAAGGFVLMYSFSIIGKVLFKKEAMGDGDIKLAVMLGAFLGIGKLLLSIFLASVIGLAVVMFLLTLKKMKREDYLPFASFLSAGAVIALFFGSGMLMFFGF
ncbi:prepilin peptidase [Candidatus Margulisiibacteriota bacterium]